MEAFSWDELGPDAHETQATMSCPMFLQLLGKQYPAAIPEVDEVLKKGGHVADIGAGFAWSSIGVAQNYPKCKVDAYDLDSKHTTILPPLLFKIVSRRSVRMLVSLWMTSNHTIYFVMALEYVHALGDPASVWAAMKKLAGKNGTVCHRDGRKSTIQGNITKDVEKFMYGFSFTCCLAECKSQPNSAETGS